MKIIGIITVLSIIILWHIFVNNDNTPGPGLT